MCWEADTNPSSENTQIWGRAMQKGFIPEPTIGKRVGEQRRPTNGGQSSLLRHRRGCRDVADTTACTPLYLPHHYKNIDLL
jgi:hypothetical protein